MNSGPASLAALMTGSISCCPSRWTKILRMYVTGRKFQFTLLDMLRILRWYKAKLLGYFYEHGCVSMF